jgi:tetratricopeptide (TPR) repeat protein
MTDPDSAIKLRNHAFALREDQDMEAAYAAISEAVQQLPGNPQARFAHAQIAFETGRPAAALFDAALALNDSNPEFVRNRAAAYAHEGQLSAAIVQLETRLARQPDWLDGHRLLVNLRVTHGDPNPARSYERAVQADPANLSLRLAWFHMLATAKSWDAARAVLAEGERQLGARPAFVLARAFIASESGEAADDPHLFDQLAEIRDPGLDLCQTRHWLRLGDPAKAEAIAARNIGAQTESAFWPYLSLAWRLMGDDRALWLDRPDLFIRSFDLDFTALELSELTTTLNLLHTARAPYLEQSVRGGTQTDGNLFLRHEPAIQLVRAKCLAAVRKYIDALPAPEPDHPLLGRQRDRIGFEGSWSVRLASQGFHSVHTHARGWISSALYVDLPPPGAMGTPPSGWIEFGAPPPELGLELAPYSSVEPAPARLVLFPSTMWHRTIPFESGERLTIAFDIRRHRR